MASAEVTKYKVEKEIKDKDIEFVRLTNVDINGITRAALCYSNYFTSSVTKKGHHMPVDRVCAVQIDGEVLDQTSIPVEVMYQNGILIPDLDSFRVLPWIHNTATVFSDFTFPPDPAYDGVCTRSACKKQLAKLTRMGYNLYSAFEFEFYIVDKDSKEPVFDEVNMFTVSLHNKTRPIITEIMTNLNKIGIKPEIYHTEHGPSQHEISISPSKGISAADNGIEYRLLVKDICNKHGYDALFVSHCYPDQSSNSAHLNHSLWDLSMANNMFSDTADSNGLSDICKNWLAGLQEHSKALTALICHTVPSYLADIPFFPKTNSWGMDNRTVLYRVISDSPNSTHIEHRQSVGNCNPYLVMLGSLIAGMDGIKRNLQLKSKPFVGNIFGEKSLPEGVEYLPENLTEALQYLKEDALFVQELGDKFLIAFEALKKDEIAKEAAIIANNNDDKFKWYRDFYGPYV